ncbi:MAG: phage tail protein [Oscillospiraceae bacterium]|nr:phage tail protein [Oscillospiraceae bacterium]
MYIVTLFNGNIETEIHNNRDKLSAGSIVKGINTIDSFSFTMNAKNPGFGACYEYKTLVSVYNTNKNRYDFTGRVLYVNPSMEDNGTILESVICESYLGFLCDSQQPYVAEKNWTVNELFSHLVDRHNAQVEEYKRFKVGTITVTDPNNNLYVGIQRDNTWKVIEDKLIGTLGGEIQYRIESDGIYLDYLVKIGATRTTAIALSNNMKAISRENNPADYISRLIPLGAKLTTTNADGQEEETEERLTIESVNGGVNYIDIPEGIDAFGIRVGYHYWDDVTQASVLLTKAQNWLAEHNKIQVKYAVTALDLSLIGLQIDDFQVHDYHPIKNSILGIDDTARIIKKNIDICEEVKSTIELGDNLKNLSEIQREQDSSINSLKNLLNKLQNATSNIKNQLNKVEQDVGKIEGIDGVYFYIRYSANADGSNMTEIPQDDTEYMGTYSTSEETAPTDYKKYTWAKIRGDGIKGDPGPDGKTTYLHVKFSNDGATFTVDPEGILQDGETLGTWIGTYTDYTEADSDVFSDYTWKQFADLVDLKTVTETHSKFVEETEKSLSQIIAREYVEKSAFEEYREANSSELKQTADDISMRFNTTTKRIEEVDGNLQSQLTKLAKYITFSDDGIQIASSNSILTLQLDNENGIIFAKNGVPFGTWDGENFHTGNISIDLNQMARFGSFAFVPRSSGNLSLMKVSGENALHSHAYAYKVAVPATCTETGTMVYTCSCGDSYTREIPKIDHNYVTIETVPPTENEAGYTIQRCSYCGDEKKVDGDPATGHTHTEVTIAGYAATCTESGLTDGVKCSSCGEILTAQETIAALGHNYVDVVTPPTETEQGYTTHTCSQCGDTYVDNYTDPTGSETIQYTITVEAKPSGGGSVSASGAGKTGTSITVDSGTKVTLTATANDGYTFDGWYEGETKLASTVLTAFENKTLTAKFIEEEAVETYTLTLTVDPYGGGTVAASGGGKTGTSSITVDSGTQVTLTATANTGYVFSGWYENGSLLTDSLTEINVTVNNNSSFCAKFVKDVATYRVNLSCNPESAGTATITDTGNTLGYFESGTVISIKATAYTGYTFDHWIIAPTGGTSYTSSDAETSVNVNSGYTIEAVFVEATVYYTVNLSVTPSGAGTASLNGNGTTATIESGAEISLSATAAVGYMFSGWYNGDTLLSTEQSYSYTPTGDITITAKFADAFVYGLYNDGEAYAIVNYKGSDKDVVIPSEYNGKSVVNLNSSVFNGKDIESVTIPVSITSIGQYVFYFGCENLKYVYYQGTKDQWAAIDIAAGNGYLTGATIYYNQ